MSTSTENSFSMAATEYLWADLGMSESHRYLTGPTLDALTQSDAKQVLDLGCGNGAFAAVLHQKGFSVCGCDFSESGLNLARKSYPGIRFFRHDIADPLPCDSVGVYDAVVSLEVIEHLFLPRLLLQRAFAALKPGGILVLSTPYHGYLKNLALALTNSFDKHWHPLRDFGHVKFFSKKTLCQCISEAGFSIRNFSRVGRLQALACSMVVVAVKPR